MVYANIRPIKTYKTSKLQLDFVCVREATEGLYAGIEFKTSDDSAMAVRKTTGKGCRRIAKKAFDLTQQKGFTKIFAITKRNILKETDGIFWNAIMETQKTFPDVDVEEYYIDNMTQQTCQKPGEV